MVTNVPVVHVLMVVHVWMESGPIPVNVQTGIQVYSVRQVNMQTYTLDKYIQLIFFPGAIWYIIRKRTNTTKSKYARKSYIRGRVPET